jgi:hypothetical protein
MQPELYIRAALATIINQAVWPAGREQKRTANLLQSPDAP